MFEGIPFRIPFIMTKKTWLPEFTPKRKTEKSTKNQEMSRRKKRSFYSGTVFYPDIAVLIFYSYET
jgi:hypothetical protein